MKNFLFQNHVRKKLIYNHKTYINKKIRVWYSDFFITIFILKLKIKIFIIIFRINKFKFRTNTIRITYNIFFLQTAFLFKIIFCFSCCCIRITSPDCFNINNRMTSCIFSAVFQYSNMLFYSPDYITGNSGIKRAVRTPEHIYKHS